VTSRTLHPDEYWKLTGTEMETIWPHLDPSRSVVLVVEDGEQIVGCWALLAVAHLEGCWIHPAYRKRTSVARRLLASMWQAAREIGARTVVTSACSADVRAMVAQLGGVELPGEHFSMRVPCQLQ